jgi:hypothetical protein
MAMLVEYMFIYLVKIFKYRQNLLMLMAPIDLKSAIEEDVKELDLALAVINGLRDVSMARLEVLQEAEKRGISKPEV